MFSNFPNFKDLDFDNFNEQSSEVQYGKLSVPTQYDEKQIVDPTAQGDIFGCLDFVTSRNAPVDVRDYEISFESTFLQEHKNAMKYQTENFIEKAFQQFDDKEMVFGCEQFTGKHLQFSSFRVEKSKLSGVDKMKEFLGQISKHQKLNSFFDFIYECYSREIANEFMYLGSVAYKKHEQTKNNEEDETNLLLKARQLSQLELERLFHGERINFLNLRNRGSLNEKRKETVKIAFRRLVQFFFATVMLIADEYFLNPFGQKENIKRERSYWNDEQKGVYGVGVKKMH